MNEKFIITVQNRELTGKKIRSLRRQGILPANIYGPKVNSVAVQLELRGFEKMNKKATETDLIDLMIEGEKETRPVLIYDVQTDPVTDALVHVDFFQVDLTEKVEVNVPIEFVGEAPAIINKKGSLLTMIDELPIKVLPTNIPHQIEVDISGLAEVGDSILLENITIPEGAEMMIEDKTEAVVKIEEERKQELAEEAAAEAVEIAPTEDAEAGEEVATEEKE